MRILNYTPHKITIVDTNSNEIVLERQTPTPRVNIKEIGVYIIDGIEIVKEVHYDVENLPEKKDNTIFIVSRLVEEKSPKRDDIVFPTAFLRDKTGKIHGCMKLGKSK